ncbi:hypothetical protein ABBQ38_000630 [Trebouxia sp. C0009 RCD-2024]
MSDSEDDKPLAARNIVAKQPAVPTKTENASTSSKPNPVSASNPQNAIKRKAAQKAPVVDSDSEDDKPLLTRAKPAVRPGYGGAVKKDLNHADAKNQVSKPKSVTVKKEAIKIEPLSPKSEPDTSPQGNAKAKKPRAKKGEGEKKVTVKKEYEKPGQTRETPSEIDPLRRFYTTLREQRPDSEMAKKWCLIHGVLDDEDAEQIAAELKLKKGQLRSPSKPVSRAPPQKRKAPPAATKKPAAGQSAKGATKSKVKQEDSDEDSFEDDDFVAPAKKVQKQGSGTTAGTSSKPKPAAGQAAKGSSGVEASAQPARARPGSGGSRPSSAQGSKGAGTSRPASGGDNKSAGPSRPSSGGSGKAAGEKPAPKPRALVASTTKDRAFVDGGLDPVSDSDSDDDMPLGQRRVQRA